MKNFNKSILAILSVSMFFAVSCKKKAKKDDCYDNHKIKACEVKCSHGEKKACAKWCYYTEEEIPCTTACKLKDEMSCKKLKVIKGEKSKNKKSEQVLKKHKKIVTPYCEKGCKAGAESKVGTDFGSLTYLRLKQKSSSTGKKVDIDTCTSECVETLVEKCSMKSFAKQFNTICDKIK